MAEAENYNHVLIPFNKALWKKCVRELVESWVEDMLTDEQFFEAVKRIDLIIKEKEK